MHVIHLDPAGLDRSVAATLAELLQRRLVASIDLQLVLKHVHWNVRGPNFIAVHEMLDAHTEAVTAMTDEIAERIATLGGTPDGNAGHVVRRRSWADFPLGRADAMEQLAELDRVYDRVIVDTRLAIDETADLDPVTNDLLIEHVRKLELDQWLIRSFFDTAA